MAIATTITVKIHPARLHLDYGSSYEVTDAYLAAGDVACSPYAKGISVNNAGAVMIQEVTNTSGVSRQLMPGTIYPFRIAQINTTGTDNGLGITVYGD